MPALKDALLEGKGFSGTNEQFVFVSIPEEITIVVKAYIKLIWTLKNGNSRQSREKSIPTDLVIDNAKKMFSDEIRSNDELWMQHCASSLRELIDDLQIPDDFCKFLKSIPKQTIADKENIQRYERLRAILDFLHCMVHFKSKPRRKENTAVDIAKEILSDKTVRAINESVFDKMCRAYIVTLYEIFSVNCMK